MTALATLPGDGDEDAASVQLCEGRGERLMTDVKAHAPHLGEGLAGAEAGLAVDDLTKDHEVKRGEVFREHESPSGGSTHLVWRWCRSRMCGR